VAFADHFSDQAADYARYRPTYPDRLFADLAGRCRNREQAWDCGTGNGQAALGLAAHFERVVATDASADQIDAATSHPAVTYAVALAGDSPLDDASVDLVTVAQALHWFDRDAFYDEVRRVARPGAVVAAWTYALFHLDPDDPRADRVDPVLERYYEDVVGPYWPAERRHIEAGYRSLAFPFEEADPPSITLVEHWSLEEVAGYLRTWSAARRYREAEGHDPVAVVADALADAWGDPETVRALHWPLPMRIGRTAER
jgi:SAM-dependent methyltransferase